MLEELLAIWTFASMLFLAMGWFPCGGCGDDCAEECLNCSEPDRAPCTLSIGIQTTAGSTGGAASIGYFGSTCDWSFFNSGASGCATALSGSAALADNGDGTYTLTVNINFFIFPGTSTFTFVKTYTEKPACHLWDEENVPYSSSSGFCADSGAICTVTAG